jgi:hypothetical protein
MIAEALTAGVALPPAMARALMRNRQNRRFPPLSSVLRVDAHARALR